MCMYYDCFIRIMYIQFSCEIFQTLDMHSEYFIAKDLFVVQDALEWCWSLFPILLTCQIKYMSFVSSSLSFQPFAINIRQSPNQRVIWFAWFLFISDRCHFLYMLLWLRLLYKYFTSNIWHNSLNFNVLFLSSLT